MSVFKINHQTRYTVMSNYHLRDNNLPYKAKGLLSFMLSLPKDWDYSVNGLVKLSKEGLKAVRSMLKELEENNYLIREKVRDEYEKFDYEYNIYEMPYSHFGHADKGNAEKDTQIDPNKPIGIELENEIFKNLINLELIDTIPNSNKGFHEQQWINLGYDENEFF